VKYFVQFHLHKQLLEASQYAMSKGIGLKGDLPIGVNRASVEAWLNPELFHLDMSTGAPPDQFCMLTSIFLIPAVVLCD